MTGQSTLLSRPQIVAIQSQQAPYATGRQCQWQRLHTSCSCSDYHYLDLPFQHVRTMSEDSLHFDPHPLRRTLSTGDIPSRELPRPPRARISHYPRYPNDHPPDPPTESPQAQPYRTWYARMMAFFGYGRRASKARRELVSLIWNLCWGFVQVCVK